MFYRAYNETFTKGLIVIKIELSKIKSQVKKNSPNIAHLSFVVLAVVYVKLSKKTLALVRDGFSSDKGTTYLAMNHECMETLKKEGSLIWNVDGHIIDIAYDPDC